LFDTALLILLLISLDIFHSSGKFAAGSGNHHIEYIFDIVNNIRYLELIKWFLNLFSERQIYMDNEHRAEVGRRIKRLRQAQDITVHELAKRSTISAGYLSEVERGLSSVSIDKLKQIAEGLGIGTEALLDDSQADAHGQNVVQIPSALSAAAERLNLSYRATLALFQGKKSLLAKRSSSEQAEWDINEWVKFYQQVKDYLPEC
jgi:transcriptional regulator with XRE-family HTH domain